MEILIVLLVVAALFLGPRWVRSKRKARAGRRR
jgi:type II secretory pathway pseudopilin PulG